MFCVGLKCWWEPIAGVFHPATQNTNSRQNKAKQYKRCDYNIFFLQFTWFIPKNVEIEHKSNMHGVFSDDFQQ